MTFRSIKINPVAWMTTLLAVLTAAEAVNAKVHLLPPSWTPYLVGAIALLTAVLGALTHGAVTPLARPRDDAGNPLVPKWAQSPVPKPQTPPDPRGIGGAGMSTWGDAPAP